MDNLFWRPWNEDPQSQVQMQNSQIDWAVLVFQYRGTRFWLFSWSREGKMAKQWGHLRKGTESAGENLQGARMRETLEEPRLPACGSPTGSAGSHLPQHQQVYTSRTAGQALKPQMSKVAWKMRSRVIWGEGELGSSGVLVDIGLYVCMYLYVCENIYPTDI